MLTSDIDSNTLFKDSYPWMKGAGVVDSSLEIDYESFVVQVTGGVTNIKPVLENLLRNSSDIKRRQLNLMKVAPYFTYSMGNNVHKNEDAFQMILHSLQFHLDTINVTKISDVN